MYVPSESIVSVQSPRGPEDPGLSVIDDAVAASTIAIVPHPHAVDAKNNLNFPKSYDGTAVSDWRCEL